MTPPKRGSNVDEDAPQSAAKRQKTSSGSSVTRPKQPSASRAERAVKNASKVAPPTTEDPQPSLKSTTSKTSTLKNKPSKKPQPRPKRKGGLKLLLRRLQPPSRPKPTLLSLPLELQNEIFLYTTARETSRLRRVCKALNWVVTGSSNFLAKRFADRELARIQHSVEEWTSLKMPTDADSLMEALRVWIKRRGHFAAHGETFASLEKLMAHLFMGKKEGQDLYTSTLVWTWIAVCALQLRLKWEEWEELDYDELFEGLTGQGLLDYGECDKFISTSNTLSYTTRDSP